MRPRGENVEYEKLRARYEALIVQARRAPVPPTPPTELEQAQARILELEAEAAKWHTAYMELKYHGRQPPFPGKPQ